MISNCIFTWGFTSFEAHKVNPEGLWIDFKLYFYVRIHKYLSQNIILGFVVNWFQIVFLREDSQVEVVNSLLYLCCELISNCIFTWGFTRDVFDKGGRKWLWIDFKLYFYVRIHKRGKRNSRTWSVVNWFQIVFLREDSQAELSKNEDEASCELISNCIFTWGFTSSLSVGVVNIVLWIDFKLYFYVRIHKKNRKT